MVSQAPSRDGLALRFPRGHLLFGVAFNCKGRQRRNAGKMVGRENMHRRTRNIKNCFPQRKGQRVVTREGSSVVLPVYALKQWLGGLSHEIASKLRIRFRRRW
jgi:hypothetical protein